MTGPWFGYNRRDPAPGYCRCNAPNIGGWERAGCPIHPGVMACPLMWLPVPAMGEN